MTTQDILTQVQQSILQERTRRGYAVVVANPRRSYGIAGIPIPRVLEAYVANTTCTVQHDHGIACQWLDIAFHRNEQIHVVLFNDLFRFGMLLEDSVTVLLAELCEDKKWDDLFHSERGQQILDKLTAEARREIEAGDIEEGGFGGEM